MICKAYQEGVIMSNHYLPPGPNVLDQSVWF